ncbi:MAG: PAS domain-containing sensor histidine kinase [Pseudomonadota bacterium]
MTSVEATADPYAERPSVEALPRRIGRPGVILLVLLGPILAIITSVVMGGGEEGRSANLLRIVLLVDVCYLLALSALIGWEIGRLVMARRRGSAGSKLHLRLTGVFAAVALVPTVIVAVFATLSVNFGIEGWFSERIGSVVRNSLSTAEAYEREHRTDIRGDVLAMATDLNRAVAGGLTQTQLSDLVVNQALLRELPEAYLFTGDKEFLARGEDSYLFRFEVPSDEQLARARTGEVVVMVDIANSEIRALVALERFDDAYLYVGREVEGDVLRLLDETRETVKLYERLEQERESILFDFAMIYVGFALLVIIAAVFLGLWFAERLARPVGRLASAAQRIGEGDLDIRVKEERGKDEIAILSRTFNRMAEQVKHQRDELIEANLETERRRNFIEAVLSGVTAGVLGLDGEGRVDLLNDAAADLLELDPMEVLDRPFEVIAPAFAPLVAEALQAPSGVARGEARAQFGQETREFLCRIAPKVPGSRAEGYVLTFDDITALASAQRMAAWGDVARRIAHEIKNPLTPIQLSTDRIRRKFVGRLGEEGQKFEELLDVIARQAAEIRRMVDEFSHFARMPEPQMGDADLGVLMREGVLLQCEARQDIAYETEIPARPIPFVGDAGLLGQCLTNLLQNAADAIDARQERDGEDAPPGRIRVELSIGPRLYRVAITDNGIGLPSEARDRLTDPYVTTRKKGTGLGLAIVKKIVEQHGGELALGDAGGDFGLDGAQVSLRFALQASRQDGPDRLNEEQLAEREREHG